MTGKQNLAASVHARLLIRRAVAAAIGTAKKNQTWAPSPERDLSTAQLRLNWSAVSTKAVTSRRQSSLSKSMARNEHVSSGSIG